MTSAVQSGQVPQARMPGAIVTPAMVELMCATRVWALIAAIVSWIAGGLMAITAVGLIVSSLGTNGDAALRLFAWPYLATALLTMVPAVLLTRYTAALGRLRTMRNEQPLVEALNLGQRLWKFAAVIVLALLALAVGGILIAVIVGAFVK